MMYTIALGVLLLAGGDPFVRGDVDGSGVVDAADAEFLAAWLWKGGEAPACLDAADVDDDGVVTHEDLVRLYWVGKPGMSPLPPPFPNPGQDPTPDGITCGTYDAPAEVTATDPEVIVAIFGGEGEPGAGEVEVPVMLRGPVPVEGLTIGVRWDTSYLRLRDIRRTGETVQVVQNAKIFEREIHEWRGEGSFTVALRMPDHDEILPPQEDFACVGVLVFEIDADAPTYTSLPVEIEPRVGEVPRFTMLSTPGGFVSPRRVGASIAVRERGRRRIRQSVRVPIKGLAGDPLAALDISAQFDPETGAGKLAFSGLESHGKTGEFPYCLIGGHLMAMALRGLAMTHGTTAYGARNLASLTGADSIVFDLREEFPISTPEMKGPPFQSGGASRGELRVAAGSPRILYFDWDVSGLDLDVFPCPGARFAFEWETLRRESPYLATALGDVYKGLDKPYGVEYYNWRRIRADISAEGEAFLPFDPQVMTIDIEFDPLSGNAVYLARIVPADVEPIFWRGDVNADEKQDIADPVMILQFLFRDGPLRPPIMRADINDDGRIDLADPITLLGCIFGTVAPRSPSWQVGVPTGGVDPTRDGI
ncbi:MAG: dockerin type I repeat-containing protein [Planctomycetes bacterium]|nr:dockerin type I repeat-containing protein [Planctomycetota bacterium]